jgi:hypothetical protein
MTRKEPITDARNLRLLLREREILQRTRNIARRIQNATRRLLADQNGRRST